MADDSAIAGDASSAASIGVSAATGNYIGAAIQTIGLGMSLFGGMQQSSDASKVAGLQSQITGQEGQINAQKQQAMQLSARRQSLQDMRTAQQTQAKAIAGATNQGAQFGSGLAGGLAQISDDNTYNQLGINQNLQIGNNIFGLDASITGEKQQISSLQSSSATSAGISSLGSAVGSSGAIVGKLSQGVKLT